MTSRRWMVVVLLAVFIAAIAVLSLRPLSGNGQLATPPGVAAQAVTVSCEPVWSGSGIRNPPATPYPISGNPCGGEAAERVMSVLDIALGVGLIGMVAFWSAESRGWRRVRGISTETPI